MSSKPLPHTAFIGLGSNLGDSKHLLMLAWQSLGAHPDISAQQLSSPYTTRPFDMESVNWFVNAAGRIATSLSPHELLSLLLEIENQLGRTRNPSSPAHQDRTIDLDLLLYDDSILVTGDLILPHPEMHKRLFVLVPLAEISPKYQHPLRKVTIAGLRDGLLSTNKIEEVQRVEWEEE